MNLKSIKIFIITILICLTFSIVSYIVGHKNFAHYIINILIAIGTCGAVVQALYLSIPQKETRDIANLSQQMCMLLLV